MTTIAVLGNGRVGGSLATALTRAGHEVNVADRSPATPRLWSGSSFRRRCWSTSETSSAKAPTGSGPMKK